MIKFEKEFGSRIFEILKSTLFKLKQDLNKLELQLKNNQDFSKQRQIVEDLQNLIWKSNEELKIITNEIKLKSKKNTVP